MRRETSRLVAFSVLCTMTVACPVCLMAQKAPVQSGFEVYSPSDLQLYIQKWHHRDGAAAQTISDYFCEFVMREPSAFFSIMEQNPTCYEQWLEELPGLSFTDYGGCVNPECIRAGMLTALTGLTLPPTQEAMKNRLIALLRSTSIRRVQ
jgi:hypothetical protein